MLKKILQSKVISFILSKKVVSKFILKIYIKTMVCVAGSLPSNPPSFAVGGGRTTAHESLRPRGYATARLREILWLIRGDTSIPRYARAGTPHRGTARGAGPPPSSFASSSRKMGKRIQGWVRFCGSSFQLEPKWQQG